MDYKVVVTRDAEEDLESFMSNPWKDISLSDYENHMSLDSVMQLQSMNQTMKSQLEDYDVHTVMILGIAGGNGLEHIDTEKQWQSVLSDLRNLSGSFLLDMDFPLPDWVWQCL